MSLSIDDRGLCLPVDLTAALDVYFDDRHVWSFDPQERPEVDEQGRRRVPWPRAMRHALRGTTCVSLRRSGNELYSREVSFGDGEGRVEFVDTHGIAVMIDKWGLIQRPFSARSSDVVTEMLEVTEQIIEILREDCGVHCWLAFGSLLGAAREGGVISHDSDVDLAFLSDHTSPAELNLEMYAVTRALRRRGLRVINKSGSFVTVVFAALDGAEGSVDVYSCFHLGGYLYETATVRAPVPREAVLPLGTLPFEGRELPVPRDVDRLLEVSYGPGWRVPDPSFKHLPGPEITERFEQWFGSLMRYRRDWERQFRGPSEQEMSTPTDFYHWVLPRLGDGMAVMQVGAGIGNDVLAFIRAGHPTTGVDYARSFMRRAVDIANAEQIYIRRDVINLFSRRDTLSGTAHIAHRMPESRALYARGLIDALDRRARANFARMGRMFLRPGDQVFLEFATGTPGEYDPSLGGQRFATTTDEVLALLDSWGAQVDTVDAAGEAPDGRPNHRVAARVTHRPPRSTSRRIE